MTAEPIMVDCEGAGCPAHGAIHASGGLCAMCGRLVPTATGRALDHQRPDILAMLARGDFDR